MNEDLKILLGCLCLLAIIIYIMFTLDASATEKDRRSQRLYNGKRYYYMKVDRDFRRANADYDAYLVSSVTHKESNYKSNMRKGVYDIYAWVEVGKEPWTWKEDPINKAILLEYEDGKMSLPEYLKKESGCKSMAEYRKKYELIK